MANWDRLTSRGNVEDRRSFGPTAIGGGLGIAGIVIYLLVSYLSGGQISPNDVNAVLNQIENSQVQTSSPFNVPQNSQTNDSYKVFASTVLGSTNDMWSKVFAQQNATYDPPKLVLFRGSTDSACGGADARVGPHYCPVDRTIYLDETFFDELKKLGAAGDVAQAYVIAHEIGHHVQNQLGIMDKVDPQNNNDSIKLELQADCYAGLWAYSIKDKGVFMPDEIKEALDAAAAVGDDRIQKVTQGSIRPETWTHGSSQQRVQWFNTGFTSGSVKACDTFSQ